MRLSATRNHRPPQMRKVARIMPKVIVGCIVFVIVALVILCLQATFKKTPYRQSMVIAGNPAHILSLNASRTALTIIDLPEDTVVSAVNGYGHYSVRSLMTLDALDNHHGALVINSLSDAIGMPISWYIDPGEMANGVGSVEMIRRIFSWGSVGKLLQSKLESSIPFVDWIGLVYALRFIPADAVTFLDVTPAIVPMESPDGSVVPTLDEFKLDFILENSLYDAGLRAENLTVAVYNTTQVPTVGSRASRQLARMGIQLVFVGNAEPAISGCNITGTKSAQKSKTAQFIRSYFSCTQASDDQHIGKGTGADLVVELGSDYAARYK